MVASWHLHYPLAGWWHAQACARSTPGSTRVRFVLAVAAPGLSPSTTSGALAIQTGQPSSVGAVRLRFELKLGLGGWNCGLKTLGCGCEGVDSVNEGVRSAAFDEGVRLAGTLRLGEVACSAASSDSLAAWGCVSLAGVSIAQRRWLSRSCRSCFWRQGR